MNDTGALLALRVEAGPQVGLGHFMRCFAVAEAWVATGGTACFLMTDCADALAGELRDSGIMLRSISSAPGAGGDAEETSDHMDALGARHLLVDGYAFSVSYLRRLGRPEVRIALFDDHGRLDEYPCDLVINQNLGASEDSYHRVGHPTPRLLTGSRYACLRSEFEPGSSPVTAQRSESIERVFVSLGGGDTGEVLEAVLEAVRGALPPGVFIDVLAGTYMMPETALAIQQRDANLRLSTSTRGVASLMAGADLAVTSAGVTVYELAALSVPSVVLALHENQRGVFQALDSMDRIPVSWYSGSETRRWIIEQLSALAGSVDARGEVVDAMSRITDGLGARRVVDGIRGVSHA